ncbi:MAG: TIGR03364 family FAD-dependent oxidoreductase [Pirellulaceae bacterium]|nr:TIGR03364 family FAD-dependent oxidoreductase [Pirellulaceae bacterium]
MNSSYDVTVVGAGIVGLAHAWMAARCGLRVMLVERTSVAQGATVRNFGMVWPIGQLAGRDYSIALRSRQLWLELADLAGLAVEACGSIHAAHQPDELAVLDEFHSLATHQTQMLTAAQVLRQAPVVQPEGLLGGMYSPTELRVDPREAAHRIGRYLSELSNVTCLYGTLVSDLDGAVVVCSDGRRWRSAEVIICSGSDLQTLYPAEFASSGLMLCKLQMLRARWSASGHCNLPHIASGLTLRHYRSFESCPTLPRLRQRVADQMPELDRFGIHVMASAFPNGRIILGDSHEYGADISPFDSSEIDQLMIRELRKVIRLDCWDIEQRWHGIYAKLPDRLVFEKTLPHQHRIFVGTGGAGMTLSLGLAEEAWQRWRG